MEKTRAKGSKGVFGWINRIDRKARWKVKGLNKVAFSRMKINELSRPDAEGKLLIG